MMQSKSGCVSDTNNETQTKKIKKKRILLCASTVCLIAAGGIYFNSVSLIFQAIHLYSKVFALLISLFSAWIAHKKPNSSFTYGWQRIEIIGTVLSVLFIWGITAVLIREAIYRLLNPTLLDGKMIFGVALLGFVVNVAIIIIASQTSSVIIGRSLEAYYGSTLHSQNNETVVEDVEKESKSEAKLEVNSETNYDAKIDKYSLRIIKPLLSRENCKNKEIINGRGNGNGNGNGNKIQNNESKKGKKTYINYLCDSVQSICILILGVILWYNPQRYFLDPICALVFLTLDLYNSFKLIKCAINILMEGAPEDTHYCDIKYSLSTLPHVVNVHDLHIWSVSLEIPSLSVHLVIDSDINRGSVLESATALLVYTYHIKHVTIQIELVDDDISCVHTLCRPITVQIHSG